VATEQWERDLSDSTRYFKKIVWPEIGDWFGDSPALHPTEGKPGGLSEAFDHIAGVDFWLVDSELGMASIASRVQDGYDRETFTVRHSRESGVDTEHQKRLRQLGDDYHLPTWTVQAYVDPTLEVLQNAAICRTEDLYNYIDAVVTPGDDAWPLIGSDESEQFYPVTWGELDPVLSLYVHRRGRAGLLTRPDNPEDITDWAEGDD